MKAVGKSDRHQPQLPRWIAYISALGAPAAQGSGLIAQSVILAVHYAFLTWSLRKIYMESTDESYRAFASGRGRLFTEEGRLR